MSTPKDFGTGKNDVPYPANPLRQDFVDSIGALRREDEAVARRRAEALKHALRARVLSSDPGGSNFLTARDRAISARRLANEQLERSKDAPPATNERAEHAVSRVIPAPPRKLKDRLRPIMAPALVAVIVLSGAWIFGPLVVAAKMYFEER